MEITSAVLFFPLILPIWQERALTMDDLYPQPDPVRITQSILALQRQGVEQGGVQFRERIAVAMGKTHHPDALRFLLQWLPTEKNVGVQATILTQLRRFEGFDASLEPKIRTYLRTPDRTVRLAAVRIYARLRNASAAELLRVSDEDPDISVRRAAWKALADRADSINPDRLLRALSDPDAAIRGSAAVCMLLQKNASRSLAALGHACKDSAPYVRCAMAARLGDPAVHENVARLMCRTLNRDANPAVRALVPDAIRRRKDHSLIPLLLISCKDPDSEVRRRTVRALPVFPELRTVEAAARALADPVGLVRTQAVDALRRLKQNGQPVARFVIPCMDVPSPKSRAAVYRTLGEIGAKETGRRIFGNLPREAEHPLALAGAIHALGRLNARFAARAIARFAGNATPNVRIEVADALGRLHDPATLPIMETLAGDKDRRVRHAAFLGMAAGGHAMFAPVLTHILRRTDPADYITAEDRTDACWCAARLAPVNPRLAQRLVVQATTPVIPMPGMKMFDRDTVLVSAEFALVEMAGRDPGVRPLAEKVLDVYSKIFTPGELRHVSPKIMVPSSALREYARQARALMMHQKIQPRLRPPVRPVLPLMPLKPSEP